MTTPRPLSFSLYRRLLGYLSRYWHIFAVSVVAMIITAATGPLFAMLIKPLINDGFVEKNLAAMQWIPLAIIGLFFIRGVANFTNEYLTSYLSGHLVQRLRGEMFDKILRLPAGYFQDNSSGRIISRVINDVAQITDAGFNVITVAAKDGVAVIGLLIWLLVLDWQLTLITFAAIPVVTLCIRVVSSRMRRLARENQRYIGQMTQILNENIDCARVVKVYGGQERENRRFDDAAAAVRRNQVKQTSSSSANTGITQLFVAVALSLIIYLAAVRAQHNAFSAGDFMSFLTAMVMMFDPLKRITGITQSLQRGMAAAESVFAFLDTPAETDSGSLKKEHIRGEIEYRGVHFRYPAAEGNALNGIDLHIQPGQMVALVGASGCGKSTLANLVPRFFDVSSGSVLLDGDDVRDYDLANLRRHMSLVSQEVVLFNDTIAQNVAYSRQDASEDSIIAALKAAHAWDFVEKLPQGIYTEVGESGTKLSGGQRQRIAIARALLKNAPVLILDEATSALDTESEKIVQAALEQLMQNRTTLVIAHRLSTIETADKIIVMHEGKIVESGTHAALLAQKGRYAALYAMQFGNAGEKG